MSVSKLDPAAARARVVWAVSGATLTRRVRLLLAVLTVALLAAGGVVVYATGGTQQVWPHVLYVPVLTAAWGFGPVGGVVAGVGAGLVVGPFMPLDTAAGESQEPLGWAYRLGFFVLVGGVAGGLNRLLHTQLAAAQRLRDRFAALVEHAPDLILVCDADGRLSYASPSCNAVLGRAPAAVEGRAFAELVHPDERPRADALVGRVRRGASKEELRVRHADGSWRCLELVASRLPHADVGAVTLNARDVTQRQAMEAELRHQVWHDPATGLANRRRLTEALRDTLAGGEDAREGVAVLRIELQRLRAVSEAFGPDARDRIVAALAQRLQHLLRPDDLLARYESDEFAIICRSLPDRDAARQLAQRLLGACDEPFLLVTGEVHIQTCIGVAMADDASDAAGLLRDASTAMWRASPTGTGRIQVFQPAWRDQAAAAVTTEHALYGALERDELELYYQPVINLRTGQAVGVEALLRWHHPQLGVVPPSDFIPIAEQTGMILPIGRWVLREACAQLATWRRDLGSPDLHVAVNLSARQLDSADLADDVCDALRHAGLPADALTLELTETTLFDDADRMLEALIGLHGLGVRLAVDDFGTGYSSLGYLKRLPVDVLKIDLMFVRQLHHDEEDVAIVSAIIGLAHSLGLETIAEGVEQPEHATTLISLGCDHVQGYHYARPQPAHQTTTVLTDLLAPTTARP